MKKTRFIAVTLCLFTPLLLAGLLTGCQSAMKHRLKADQAAERIIKEKQMEALGRNEPFSIEGEEEPLRKRLIEAQDLPYSDPASLGTKSLEQVEHWPNDNYLEQSQPEDKEVERLLHGSEPLHITLVEALQIGARNSREYQSQKESLFQSALSLERERREYKTTFSGSLDSQTSTDLGGDETVTGVENDLSLSATKKFLNGITAAGGIGVDFVKLFTQGKGSSLGLVADTSISIPLLRGSGRHIAAESLTQAERDVVYSIYSFERYKRTFAVQIASEYLSVLRQIDQMKNADENYRSLITSARRARRMADAGRISEVDVDQALQDELRARDRWISANQTYQGQLDSFKMSLGLPPDANITLERNELTVLAESAKKVLAEQSKSDANATSLPADAPIVLPPPNMDNAGPYELDETLAVKLALENRLDLKIDQGEVYDSQRAVIIAADALRPELTLFGSANAGEGRSLGSADSPNADLRFDKGFYSALLSLDLGLERTSERINYRNSYINLERAVRNLQSAEDHIKQDIRSQLRDLLESREGLQIQALAVELARKRVESSNLFLQAGQAEIRDLLDAQEDLISAQNSLTSALVNYRIAELELQRDMGLLQVNEVGLWQEYIPEEKNNDRQ